MIYLHVGMSKAGSSAIQRAIRLHEGELRAHGIVVPRAGRLGSEFEEAHTPLAKSLSGEHPDPALWTAALEEIDESGTGLISSEAFWLMSEQEVARTAAMVEGRAVRVVLYLRDPASYVVSSYLQAVKQQQSTDTFREHAMSALPRLNYANVIRRWRRVGPVTVVRYEDVRHGIEPDFFARIGAGDLPTPAVLVNATPNLRTLRVLRAVNHVLRHLPRRRWKPIRDWILQHEHLVGWCPEIDVSTDGILFPAVPEHLMQPDADARGHRRRPALAESPELRSS